ncbi:helix-turn-helix transcriptional regulator [Flavisolibacter sp. BT320]|nr:helix-turn-helix transcriptional regulator [Flavisolibacter longurius]
METTYSLEPPLNYYVKKVIVLESNEAKNHRLPFYADGYPGIIFCQAGEERYLLPTNKKLSSFFLYGQTIKPIEIDIEGPYRLVIFQLYPFASKILFNVNPKELNDDCYDLSGVKTVDTVSTIDRLHKEAEVSKQVSIVKDYLQQLLHHITQTKENKLPLVVDLIVSSNGTISISALTKHLHMTERTLQRQFIEHVGISPKQFAKIIQFQSALTQISTEAHSRLTEVVFNNGYADQSHFIRSFKKYTDKKPSQYKKGR